MYICEYIYSTVQREALSSYAIYICKCKQTCSPFIEAFWYASQFHCESVSMHLTWSLNGCVMARRHGRLTVCLLYRVVVFSWLLIYIEQPLPIASKIKFSVVSHIAFNKLFFFFNFNFISSSEIHSSSEMHYNAASMIFKFSVSFTSMQLNKILL